MARFHLRFRAACAGTALALWASFAQAAAPDEFAGKAGAQPGVLQARAAVLVEMERRAESPTDLRRVRFLSGPQLVTGTNYAQGREQAWMMCVVEGSGNVARGPLQLELTPWLLRNEGGQLKVVQAANWRDFDSHC